VKHAFPFLAILFLTLCSSPAYAAVTNAATSTNSTTVIVTNVGAASSVLSNLMGSSYSPNAAQGFAALETSATNSALTEMNAAEAFLAKLKNDGRLPGATEKSRGSVNTGNLPMTEFQVAKYPFAVTLHVIFSGDTFTNHYTMLRLSKDTDWQLQRAWRTDTNDHTLVEWPCPFIWGQGNILDMASSQLRKFLADHPGAASSLSNAVSEAFAGRTVQLAYFHTDDELVPRASHEFPTESSVNILIRENQQPCDEFIGLIYEVLNAEGDQRFAELEKQAIAGTITRTNFVRGIMRQEFPAVIRVQRLLKSFKLSEPETATSYFYSKIIYCPDNFEAYVTYRPPGVTRNQFKEYEQLYDSLQKKP